MSDYEKLYRDLLAQHEEFVAETGKMRELQNKYFKNRTRPALDASIAQEKVVDQLLREEKYGEKQRLPDAPTLPLFPEEGGQDA